MNREKIMGCNKIVVILPATTILLVSTILSMTASTNNLTSAFAQSDGTNQTIQNSDQSSNQPSKAIQGNVSDIVTNITKGAKSMGSNITTEIAKEVAENIGKKLQDLAK
jgi:hypothetical protein